MKVKSKLSDTANNYLKHTKKQKGITLIALVITIIVLLILAGVSIATLMGPNGILTQANTAKEDTAKAGAKEKVQMEVLGSYNNSGTLDMNKLKENLKNNLGLTDGDITENSDGSITVTVDGYEVKVDSNGNVTVDGEGTGTPPATGETELSEIKGKYFDKDKQLTIDGKKILIPGGATVSGIDSECSSISGDNLADKDDGGLVIYITNGATITDWEEAKTTYDQFVWIPVETPYIDLTKTEGELTDAEIKQAVEDQIELGKYPMAIKNGENYLGVLYGFNDGENGTLEITPHSNWTPLGTRARREPDEVNSDSSNSIPDGTLQSQYNTMVTRVATNGGFWVGRYETSNMNSGNFTTTDGAVNIVKGKGANDGIASVTWYKMYEGQKAYREANIGSKSTTTSSMIWGSQWDQIMLWMRKVPSEHKDTTYTGNFYITNSVGMGNFGVDATGTKKDTKKAENTGYYGVKNIYDLAGNVYDWTLEAVDTFYRVLRRRRLQRY